MNWRSTVAAGIIFLVLLAFVWVESGHRVAEEGEVFRRSFLGLNLYGIDPEDVSRMKIQRADEDDVILEKRDDRWYLVEPFNGLADSDEVMRMVKGVAELSPAAEREGVDLTDEKFGLADADLVASITHDENETAWLRVGAEAPTGTQRYAQISGQDKLYVVGANVRTTLWKDPESLREKSIAQVEAEDVEAVTLDHGDEHVVAVRAPDDADAKWLLSEPMETRADEWNVKQLINKVGDLTAEGFLSEEEQEQIDPGFKEPQAKIALKLADDDEPLTVTFGKTEKREVGDPAEEKEVIFVRTSDRSEVMLAEADVLDSLKKTPFDLRDKSVVSFDRKEAQRVKVDRSEGLSFTVARRPDGWFVERPENFQARQGAVDDILWNLEDLSAVEFVTEKAGPQELREYGLASPQVTITLELQGRDDPLKVMVGEETEETEFYATTSETEQVVKISEFLMGDMPQKLDDLRKSEVEAPETEVPGIGDAAEDLPDGANGGSGTPGGRPPEPRPSPPPRVEDGA